MENVIKLNETGTFTNDRIKQADRYKKLGKYARAIKECDKAVALNPNDPLPYSFRGEIYEFLGDYQKSLDDYNKAIKLDTDNIFYTLLYTERASLLTKMGDYPSALLDYSHLLSMMLPFPDVPYVDLFESTKNLIKLMEDKTNLIVDPAVYGQVISTINKLADPQFSLFGDVETLLKHKLSELQERLNVLRDNASQG
jgi:tetratricopeptide (TPR) repeat protein